MIISKTPFRISFFGGGTDYPTWFREHGGAVVGTTIDKYCYLSVRILPPFFEHRHRIVWSQIELVDEARDIEHPAVRAILDEFNVDKGLGTSSSFSVGLLNALHALGGRMISKRDLAAQAIHIEQDVIKEAVGSQDQIWAAYGGLNRIDLRQDGGHDVSSVILQK